MDNPATPKQLAGRYEVRQVQLDENNFYRTVVRNGEKGDEIKVPHKGDKKSFRTIQIRVGPNEITSLIRQGENWAILERWAQAGSI